MKRGIVFLVLATLAMSLFAIGPAAAAPPSNDDFDSATPVGELPYETAVLANEATAASDDPNCFGGARTVWYRVVPSTDMRLIVDTAGSNFDSTLGVYTGARGSLTQVACNDDHIRRQSEVRFDVTGGTPYHIMVGSLTTGVRGALKLHVRQGPPAAGNDELAAATAIQSVPFSDWLDTSGTTVDPGGPNCLGSRRSVWYSFVAPEDLSLLADTAGSSYDTTLGIWSENGDSLESVACVDDVDSLQAKALFDAEAGKSYLMMVGDLGDRAGELRFSLDVGPDPLTVNTTVARRGTVTRSGVARIHGTILCARAANGFLSGSIRQQRNGRTIRRFFFKEVSCGHEATTWRARVRGFHEGRALVRLRSTATETGNPFQGQDSDRVRVRLRRN
jgi:(2Fe-2S) ferredoxin